MRKRIDQYANDIDRLEQRGKLVIESMNDAPDVKQGHVDEAARYFEHMILYLRAATK